MAETFVIPSVTTNNVVVTTTSVDNENISTFNIVSPNTSSTNIVNVFSERLETKDTVVGTGIANFIPKFLNASGIGISNLYQLNSNVGINNTNPLYNLDVGGNARVNGFMTADTAQFATISGVSSSNKTKVYFLDIDGGSP